MFTTGSDHSDINLAVDNIQLIYQQLKQLTKRNEDKDVLRVKHMLTGYNEVRSQCTFVMVTTGSCTFVEPEIPQGGITTLSPTPWKSKTLSKIPSLFIQRPSDSGKAPNGNATNV